MYTQLQDQPATTLAAQPAVGVDRADASSPLQRALNEQGEQLAILAESVSYLARRLEPVRLQKPLTDEAGPNASAAPTSSLVSQVHTQIAHVRLLQAFVGTLIDELEV